MGFITLLCASPSKKYLGIVLWQSCVLAALPGHQFCLSSLYDPYSGSASDEVTGLISFPFACWSSFLNLMVARVVWRRNPQYTAPGALPAAPWHQAMGG